MDLTVAATHLFENYQRPPHAATLLQLTRTHCNINTHQHKIEGINSSNYFGFDTSALALRRASNKHPSFNFQLLDLVDTIPPKTDAFMVREVLQHLPLRVCVCYCKILQLVTTATRCMKCCNTCVFGSVCVTVTATRCNSLQPQHGARSAAILASSSLCVLLQHIATHYNCNTVLSVLQHSFLRVCSCYSNTLHLQHGSRSAATFASLGLCLLLQHAATAMRFTKCCNNCFFGSVRLTATHCNTLQHTDNCNTVCGVLQHSRLRVFACYYDTLQYTATGTRCLKYCNICVFESVRVTATNCNTLQHTAAPCNTL